MICVLYVKTNMFLKLSSLLNDYNCVCLGGWGGREGWELLVICCFCKVL